MEGGKALQCFHDLSRAIRGPDLDKDMDMIGLDSQCENGPAFLLALLLNELLATLFELARENGLPSFWAPDEMIDDQVNTMLISLVL